MGQRNKYVQSHLQQAEIRCQFRPALDGSSVEGALAQCHWCSKRDAKSHVKGLAKDDKSLKECGITSGSKVMVIGSTFDDVLALVRPSAQTVIEEKQKSSPGKEPLSQQKLHLKVIDKAF